MRVVHLVLVASLVGCSTQTPISQMGNNFVCNGQADYWKEWSIGVGGRETQDKCRQAAKAYCAQSGRNEFELSAKYSNSGPARPSSAEVVFSCSTVEEQRIAANRAKQVSDAQFKKSIAEVRQVCIESYGFKPDTPDLSRCMLEIQKERAADQRNAEANATLKESTQAMLEEQERQRSIETANNIARSIQNAAPRRMTCTTYGSTTNCYGR